MTPGGATPSSGRVRDLNEKMGKYMVVYGGPNRNARAMDGDDLADNITHFLSI